MSTSDLRYSERLNYIAYTLAEEGQQLDRALGLVREALQTEPDCGPYLDTLGWVYYQMGDYERAEQALVNAVKHDSDDPAIIEHYGDVLAAEGKVKKAVVTYHRALRKIHTAHKLDQSGYIARIEHKLEKINGENAGQRGG